MACISSNAAIAAGTIVTMCVWRVNLSLGVNQIAVGQSDVVVAGGVDFMSDVPIRVSRGLRKTLLTMNKTKGTMARLGVLAGVGLKNISLEVCVFACCCCFYHVSLSSYLV